MPVSEVSRLSYRGRSAARLIGDFDSRAVLLLSLTIGTVLRVWLSLHDDGIYWPDEIHQTLEPAHRLVFGYGLVAWEFVDGARNWAMPGIVAAFLKLSALLGYSDPHHYLVLGRLVFSGIGIATAWGSYRLARVQGAGGFHAAAGASLFALGAPLIYFAPRAMSETASALPIVWGFAWCLRDLLRRRELILGTSLLGLAVMLRLQNGIFCLALLGIFAARRQWRTLLEALAVFAIWALAFGLLDKLTWGNWFHSAAVYLRFNLIEHKAELWGTAPVWYYFRTILTSWGLAGLAVGLLSIAAIRKAPALLATVSVFFVLHSFQPHKELRFILPVVPLLCSLVAIGLKQISEVVPRRVSLATSIATIALAVLSASGFHQLTFGDLGYYDDAKRRVSAYDDSGAVNRLLLEANRRKDLCGLKIERVPLALSGGYSYLHKKVPLYPDSGPPRNSGLFNYVITSVAALSGGELIASDGNLALVKIGPPSCIPDLEYSWRLP